MHAGRGRSDSTSTGSRALAELGQLGRQVGAAGEVAHLHHRPRVLQHVQREVVRDGPSDVEAPRDGSSSRPDVHGPRPEGPLAHRPWPMRSGPHAGPPTELSSTR